jgi:hypothetical protein
MVVPAPKAILHSEKKPESIKIVDNYESDGVEDDGLLPCI